MLQTAGNVRALMRHRDNHRNIYGVAYSQKIQIGNRCIQHNSHSTLRLHVLRRGYRPYSLGRPATNAAEHRDIRGANDCIADRLLRSKGIDRKHGIGVTIPNNCKIGGKDKAFDPASVDDNSAGLENRLRDLQNMLPQTAADLRDLLLFSFLPYCISCITSRSFCGQKPQ